MTNLMILAAEEGGHGAIEAGTGGWWADTAGIMLVLPFLVWVFTDCTVLIVPPSL